MAHRPGRLAVVRAFESLAGLADDDLEQAAVAAVMWKHWVRGAGVGEGIPQSAVAAGLWSQVDPHPAVAASQAWTQGYMLFITQKDAILWPATSYLIQFSPFSFFSTKSSFFFSPAGSFNFYTLYWAAFYALQWVPLFKLCRPAYFDWTTEWLPHPGCA